jgi:hypothetical protein
MVSDKLDRCRQHASQTSAWLEPAVFSSSTDKNFARRELFCRRRADGAG